MVRGTPFWSTPSQHDSGRSALSFEYPGFSPCAQVGDKPTGYDRNRVLELRKATHVLHPSARFEELEQRYMELERRACQAAYGAMPARYSPHARATFFRSPSQVEEQEVANVLDTEVALQPASSPVCDMADEEVILVPRPGRWQDYLIPSIDAYDDMSSLPSPAASTVSRDVTSPAPISQASSPFNAIQFTVAPSNARDYGNGHSDIEVDRHPSSPSSEYSTPSTAIPSPYNKLNSGGAFPHTRRYDRSVTTLPKPQSRVIAHAPKPMTREDGFAIAGTPPPPTRWSKAGGFVFAGSPPLPQSRWSKAPQDLPKDYFGGPGFAPVRPSTLARFNNKKATPPFNHATAPAPMPMPMPQHQQPQQPIGYWEASIDGTYNDYPPSIGYPEAQHPQTPPLLPRPLTDRSEWHHRVAHLDENAGMALAFWFSGLIVNRLAYPNAAAFNPKHPRFKQPRRYSGHFDPYHVVSGHSYADGHIVVAPELAQHMYEVIQRIKTAETFVAAVYFLDRLPLHDVDGHHGSEFRTHLIPRHAGDVRYALERRVAAIIISLAHNTLEDRDFHLPNSMMWEIGAMEKTRFNTLKLRALQDLNWDVHITSEDWRRFIKDAGIALYPADPCCSTAIVTLEPEHREILARAFAFMWNAANQLSWGPESPASSPAAVGSPPMSRESSSQSPNYDHGYGPSPAPKVCDFAYAKSADPYAYAYSESSSGGRNYAFDYNDPSTHGPRDSVYPEPGARDYNSAPGQPAYVSSSARNSRDFAYANPYAKASYNPAPPAPAIQAAPDVTPLLEEAYVTRTASQEARARRARDAYMAEHEARARHAAETREDEMRAQRENALALEDELEALVRPHAELAAASEVSPEHSVALGRQHRREVTKQMRAQELRAKRARALYLQRTYGQKSRNMILA